MACCVKFVMIAWSFLYNLDKFCIKLLYKGDDQHGIFLTWLNICTGVLCFISL